MLDASREPQRAGELWLAPDHAVPTRWYLLPDTVRLRSAALTVFRASPGAVGGGVLDLEVDLGIPPAALDAAKSELAATSSGPAEIVLPDWIEGTVSLVGPLASAGDGPPEGRMVVAQLARTMPALVGDNVAAFGVRTDEDGASLLRQVVSSGSIPGGVVYELVTTGLMGALGIRIDVDLRAAYDRIAAEIALTTRFGTAALSRVVEQMITDRVMQVVVVDASGGDAAHADAVVQASEELATRLLQPTLSPVAFGPGVPKAQYVDLGFTLRVERDQLEAQASFDYVGRRARRYAHRPQGSLAALLDGVDPATVVREVSGVDPFFASTSVTFELDGGLAAAGMSTLSVRSEWGVARTAPDGAPALAADEALVDAATSRAVVSAAVSGAVPYRWRARATYARPGDSPPTRTSDWFDGAGRALYLEPTALFPTATVTIAAGKVDFGWIARVDLRLGTGDDARTASLDIRTTAATFRFALPLDSGALALSATFHGADGEPTWTAAPAVAAGSIVMLDAPFADSLSVVVVPVPTATTVSIVVSMVREEPASGFRHERAVTFSGPDWSLQRALLRRLDAASSTFTYTVTVIDDRGANSQPPIVTSATAIAVGDAGREPRRVLLVLVRGAPSATGDLGVEATVTPVDAAGAPTGTPATHVFQGNEAQAEVWTTASAGAPVRYSVRVQRIGADGKTQTSERVVEGDPVVLDP